MNNQKTAYLIKEREPTKREKRLESVLEELADCVGWSVLHALDAKEIKDSYSDLARIYNKAQRLLNKK